MKLNIPGSLQEHNGLHAERSKQQKLKTESAMQRRLSPGFRLLPLGLRRAKDIEVRIEEHEARGDANEKKDTV